MEESNYTPYKGVRYSYDFKSIPHGYSFTDIEVLLRSSGILLFDSTKGDNPVILRSKADPETDIKSYPRGLFLVDISTLKNELN